MERNRKRSHGPTRPTKLIIVDMKENKEKTFSTSAHKDNPKLLDGRIESYIKKEKT